MSVPQELLELVERFNTNREAYRSGQYNETQLRREFIDPFFQLLGWDVNNEKGYAEAYKDVIHEDSIKIGGLTKAPDYCFRIGGVRKFFVETKRPSVNIKDDIDPAFQLRRYAWSAKLPLSILTDFEEFAVYDCRVKPNKTDKASAARIMYVGNWGEFTQHWDEIASIFSREAVLKGSFDRYAESSKAKKGTAEVDTAFLKEIESWRDALARNLALRNPELSQRDLNFAVQRTIDRIIFLRICEDRGIERYGQLMALQNGDRVYEQLCELFYRADERYNSGLFHFQKEKDRSESPDTLTPNLTIDDGALRDVIKNLYYPDSPYEFSVLSADILGQVYEQFLGKVIRLTAGHRAVVEEKPEVRKAGGIYYTPTYIVDYIVKNTVGQLVKSEIQNPNSKIKSVTPKDISKIRILDPACGSGSFLLGAYQYLLDWHRDWYVANDPEKWATGRSPTLYQVADSNPQSLAGSGLQPEPNISVQSRTIEPAEKWATGRSPALYQSGKSEIVRLSAHDEVRSPKSETDNWRLTTAERRRILLNNIYGVDIDPQAVEVTKLSLLLKVLEGESEQTIVKQLKMFHERALPDLGNNIKCGNSLIGTDFYHGKQMNLFDGDECYRINVFDWDKEFPEIIKPAPVGREQGAGGFDVVIGNPPYGYMIPIPEQEYFSTHYTNQDYQKDFYLLFLERYEYLLKSNGILGVIVSNTWLQSVTFQKFRKYLSTHYCWLQILHLPEKVFRAVIDTHVLIFQKTDDDNMENGVLAVDIRRGQEITFWHSIPWKDIPKNGSPINIVAPIENQQLFRKIQKNTIPLLKLCNVYNGIKPFEKGKGNPPQTDQIMKEKPYVREGHAPDKTWSPLLRGSLIARYENRWNNDYWILYGPWLAAPRDSSIFDEPLKIVVRQTGDSIIATLVKGKLFARDNLHIVLLKDKKYDLHYILALMNSRLIDFIYTLMNPEKGEALAQVKKYHVEQLTIRTINFSAPDDKARHDRMVALVDQMLELHKQLSSAKTDHDKTVIQRQIDATDRQIDQLVYELYGLTEEEIKIVEEGSP